MKDVLCENCDVIVNPSQGYLDNKALIISLKISQDYSEEVISVCEKCIIHNNVKNIITGSAYKLALL